MKNKNSVIFIKDWKMLVKSLSKDNQLYFWDLFTEYEVGKDILCENEFVLPIWNFIKSQLDNMNQKYQDTIVERNKINGSKGGRPPKTEQTQQDISNPKNPMGLNETQKTLNNNNNDNNNNNNNKNVNKKVDSVSLDDRKLKFSLTLKDFSEKYDREMLKAFNNYWTEPNKSKTKMRFESEKFWDLAKRLVTWHKNEKFKAGEKKSENKDLPAPPPQTIKYN